LDENTGHDVHVELFPNGKNTENKKSSKKQSTVSCRRRVSANAETLGKHLKYISSQTSIV